jgi:hypothetical protein
MNNLDIVLKERGSNYGSFDTMASLTQTLEGEILSHAEVNCSKELTPYMKESIHMICHKLSRIVNGDPTYIDSWLDIGGYSKLVVDELSRKQE